MLENAKGSQEGRFVSTFEKNKIYDVSASLAEIFIRESYAKEVSDTLEEQKKEVAEGFDQEKTEKFEKEIKGKKK